MPQYDFYCEKCNKEVSLTLTFSEREKGDFTCPHCGGKNLQPQMATFFSKTSRKS